ncbi:nuclear transport factor 2 family protein [Gordonia rubripertincta]|nr:nuclear transport factor 2 family protein [Gordonia rubripertincta]MDG6783791.1 nuclear transport factor 2 family protein [Gordonia rubripertincta]
MTTTTPELETTRTLLEAADTDISAFFALFSTDCAFRMGNNDVVTGRENIQAWVATYLRSVAGMRHVILEEFTSGNITALRVEVTYTMQNGEEFTLPAVTRTRVENGAITEYLIFMDVSPVVAATSGQAIHPG